LTLSYNYHLSESQNLTLLIQFILKRIKLTSGILHKVLASVLFIFITFSIQAWNARGHMIIAAIAYQELSDQHQATITDILTKHPEYDRTWRIDYKQVQNEVELGLYLFMRASVWADKIRSYKHDDHQLNAPKWHYMNYELRFPYDGEVKVADQENVLDAIDLNLKIFKDVYAHITHRS